MSLEDKNTSESSTPSPVATDTRTFVAARSKKNPLFEETSFVAIQKAKRRQVTLVVSILGVIGLVAAVWGVQKASENRQNEIVADFLRAEVTFNDETEKMQTLFQLLQSKGQPMPTGLDVMHDQSTALYMACAEKHPDSPLGWQAGLKAGAALMGTKNYDKAQKVLSGVAEHSQKSTLIQVKVRRTLAGLAAEQGQFDVALAEIAKAEKFEENPSKDELALFKAQVLHLAGKNDEAATLLKELMTRPAQDNVSAENQVKTQAALWLSFWDLKK